MILFPPNLFEDLAKMKGSLMLKAKEQFGTQQQSLANRVGQFKIPRKWLKTEGWNVCSAIYHNMFITRCECLFDADCFLVYAHGFMFDELKENESIPEYNVFMSYDDQTSIKVTFKRL